MAILITYYQELARNDTEKMDIRDLDGLEIAFTKIQIDYNISYKIKFQFSHNLCLFDKKDHKISI